MQRDNRVRPGFTLVELLVVISILTLLAGLSAGVYLQQARVARRSATIALLTMLQPALDERLEAFERSTQTELAVLPQHRGLANGSLSLTGSSRTGEPAAVVDRRAYLIARLDAMRGEFPQQFVDFLRAGDGGLADNRVIRPNRQAILQEYLTRTASPASLARDGSAPEQASAAHPFPAAGFAYSADPLRKGKFPAAVPHDPETESSECLYLILSAVAVDGRAFDLHAVPKHLIADTDQDGLLEFVDGWGNPLRFYRWPTDYLAYLQDVDGRLSAGLTRNAMDPDGLLHRPGWFGADEVRQAFEGAAPGGASGHPGMGGFFRLHEIHSNKPAIDLQVDEASATTARSYPSLPVVVSSGPDGAGGGEGTRWRAFGLAWPGDRSRPEPANLDARCGRAGGTRPNAGAFQPDDALIEAVADNLVGVRREN